MELPKYEEEHDNHSEEEKYCIVMIRDLQERYERAAKPYFDRLMLIQGLKPPRPIFMTKDEAINAGLLPPYTESAARNRSNG